MRCVEFVAIGIALVLAAGAGPDPGELAHDSTTNVMVPDDQRFADSWKLTLQEGA